MFTLPMHIPFEIGPGISLRASTSFSSSVILLSECSISFIRFCRCSCKALWMLHTKEASEILSWPALHKLQFCYILIMKLLTIISLTLMNTNEKSTWMWKMRQCIKNIEKRKELSDFTKVSTLQSENYTLVTDGLIFVYELNFDISDSTKYRNGFPENSNSVQVWWKANVSCRHFLFMINQSGVKFEARETPHCILTTTAIAK